MDKRKLSSYERSLFIAILGLWLITAAVTMIGMWQVEKVSSALGFSGEHSFELGQHISKIDLQHGRILSGMEDWFFSRSLRREMPETARKKVEEERLLALLDQQNRDVESLGILLGVLVEDPKHIQQKTVLNATFAYWKELAPVEADYARQVESLFNGESLDDASLSFARSRLAELVNKYELAIRQLVDQVRKLSTYGQLRADEVRTEAYYSLVLAVALAIILGTIMAFQIKGLQSRVIHSEKAAVLGATAITLHHEINNPLAVILGNTYLLMNGKLSEEEQKNIIKIISDMAQQIGAVVKKIGAVEQVSTVDYLKGHKMLHLPENKKDAGQAI